MNIVCLFLAPYLAASALAQDKCAEIVKSLDLDFVRLKEYTEALKNAHKERDFQLITVLNGQIDETLRHMRIGEAQLVNCPKAPGPAGPAIGPVKTQDTKFANLSCDDLRKKYIQVSRKYHSLSRRRQSLLSELSPEERVELREAEDSITAIDQELKKRCGPPPAPKPFRRTRQPAWGGAR
ncbi:MAG: hypothetical protein ACP5U1_11760 [Desulfomonilaceae bacterium]